MIWIPYDGLNKFHSFHVVAVVNIISRRGLSIDAHRNQPDKTKLTLYKAFIHINNSCGYICNKKMDVMCVAVCVLMH